MDTRNIAHDKKVQQEKKHHGEDPSAGAVHEIQPGKKPEMVKHDGHEDPATERAEAIKHEQVTVPKATD
jgi:hypothetical protein